MRYSRNKYHNKKVKIDEISFDSIAEAKRFEELSKMLLTGEISHLMRQPRFELQPSFRKNSKTYRKIEYVADFQYIRNGKTIIEDVKGFEVPVFKIKRKMFEYQFPDLELVLIKRDIK